MNTGKTLFAPLMDFLPWSTFDRIVARYNGNRAVRTLPCAAQYGVPPAVLRFYTVVGVDGPAASGANVATSEPNKGTAHMIEIKRLAVDTSKSVFTVHAVDAQDCPVLRRDLKRAQFEAFFAKQSPTEVVLEACGSSHYWGRVLTGLGHRVKLISPQYH